MFDCIFFMFIHQSLLQLWSDFENSFLFEELWRKEDCGGPTVISFGVYFKITCLWWITKLSESNKKSAEIFLCWWFDHQMFYNKRGEGGFNLRTWNANSELLPTHLPQDLLNFKKTFIVQGVMNNWHWD